MARVHDGVFVTAFGEVELANALQLRVFRKSISRQDAEAAGRTFEQDQLGGVFSMQPVSPAIFELAKRLSRKHSAVLGTRTLDLLHVAAAVHLGADAFLSFDANQRKLAHAVGLSIHPRSL